MKIKTNNIAIIVSIFWFIVLFNEVKSQISNANISVPTYNQNFQYGTNPGYYGNGWSDKDIADIDHYAGINTLRLSSPEHFVLQWGYNIRTSEFNYYVQTLGMKELTLFVGEPSTAHKEDSIFPTSTMPSEVFKNLYDSIWDNGQNGTPINENNYFATYIYHLVQTYGDKIRFWEIVNEPDFTSFWDNGNLNNPNNWYSNPPKPADLPNLKSSIYYYIRMLRIAYTVIKTYYPNSYITPGGLGYPAFLDALLRYSDNPIDGSTNNKYPLKGGAYFDVLSFHSYPSYSVKVWDNTTNSFVYHRNSDWTANAVIDLKNEFENVLINRGYDGITYPKKYFICTEVNIPRKDNIIPDYWGGEEAQRNFILKTMTLSQINEINQVYTFVSGDEKDFNTATSPYQLMGLYENLTTQTKGNQVITKEGIALKTMSQLLLGWTYDAPQTTALNLSNTIKGAAFKKGNDYRYILWAETTQDKSETASATFNFPNTMHLDSIYQYSWNFGIDTTQKSRISANNILLSGTPTFFGEANGNSVDIESLKENISYSLYPNPSNNLLHLIKDNGIHSISLKVLNVDGKIIKSFRSDTLSHSKIDLDVSSLDNGLYFLEITNDKGEIELMKFMIGR